MDLPSLQCLNYATAEEAEQDCSDGIFLMWGEFFNATTGIVESAFEGAERAERGPYYCSTCVSSGNITSSSVGYGYVGELLPAVVDNTTFGDPSGTICPLVVFDTVEETSCLNLQRFCEVEGHGWLTYAKSFENHGGVVVCSNGCISPFLGIKSLEFGYFEITSEVQSPDLRSWPMIFMWSMIAVLFGAAMLVDYKYYYGDMKEWFSRFFFSAFGYINMEGKKNSCFGQMCINPVPCCINFDNGWFCCCCRCCRPKDEDRVAEREANLEIAHARIGFVSLLILSLGVAILFGDGEQNDMVCRFDALPPTAEDIPYETALPYAFLESTFGKYSERSAFDGMPTARVFTWDFFVAELAIIMYEMAQELLAYNLVRADILSLRSTLYPILINSTVFLICAWSLYWGELNWDNLWFEWTFGFLIAIFLTPCFNAMAYLFAYFVAHNRYLPNPPALDDCENSKKGPSKQSSGPKDTKSLHNDTQDDEHDA